MCLGSLLGFTQDKPTAVHCNMLQQIGYSLMVRYHQRTPDPNLQLKGGMFWQDVLHSLSGMRQFCLNTILTSNKSTKIEYEELKAAYKFEDGMAKIPHWTTFMAWLQSGFEFRGHKLVRSKADIDPRNKAFYPNPSLVGLYVQEN